ncbi:hypothetical protein CIB48_g1482 [Xylaria polymorpha]|nr:hypothetical protein CIB48_g1482 [Xylaria polymorpha]
MVRLTPSNHLPKIDDTPYLHRRKAPIFSAERAELMELSLGKPRPATSIRSIKSLVPLLDRVLVQRIKAETKTAGGIFLPESSVKELNEAKVLAVGPGALSKDGQRVPMGVAQGDRVLIPQFGGSPVKVGEDEYHLFRDSE